MPGQLYASSEGSLPIFSRPPRDSFSPGPIYTWKQAQRWGVTCPRPQSTEGLGQDLGPKPPLLHPLGLFSGGTCPRGGLGAEGARGEGGRATWSSRASLPTRSGVSVSRVLDTRGQDETGNGGGGGGSGPALLFGGRWVRTGKWRRESGCFSHDLQAPLAGWVQSE